MSRRRIRTLKRTGAQRPPKIAFVIFSEGANTEPQYFSTLFNIIDGSLVEYEIVSASGVPATIADLAIKEAKTRGLARVGRKKKNSFESEDQVWVIFDRDEHPNYHDAINRCVDQNIGVAYSDPCFELWILLHFVQHHAPDDHHQIQRLLKQHCPDYDPARSKSLDCRELILRVEEAECRAEVQIRAREEEGAPSGRPSTTVGRLTKAIREASTKSRRP